MIIVHSLFLSNKPKGIIKYKTTWKSWDSIRACTSSFCKTRKIFDYSIECLFRYPNIVCIIIIRFTTEDDTDLPWISFLSISWSYNNNNSLLITRELFQKYNIQLFLTIRSSLFSCRSCVYITPYKIVLHHK